MSRETLSIYVAAHKEEQMDLPDGYKICQVNAEKSGQWPGPIVHDNVSIIKAIIFKKLFMCMFKTKERILTKE